MLEKEGVVSNIPKKGRILTDKGKSFVDKLSLKMVKKA
jgi:ribosomal protein S19E (S16A)